MLRVSVLLAALAMIAAACSYGGSSGTRGSERRPVERERARATCDDGGNVDVEQIKSTSREAVPSALDDRSHQAFPEPLVDLADIRSGGPPPDGIPAIDEPKFVRQCSVDWLGTAEPVLALELNGDARAYPLQIMTWHELVNDTVGDVPLTVSYCPLCNSAIAYDRRAGERILDFGTSGSLLHSSLVMYDRQTESLWSHFTATAVVGTLTGTELDVIPVQTVSFADFREAHPDGLVLTRDTGHNRDYGRNPYTGYDDPNTSPFLFEGEFDDVLPAKTRVVTVDRGDASVAIVLDGLLDQRVVEFELGGQQLVALAKPGTASALDRTLIADGRDVGATGVFLRKANGQNLTFVPTDSGFRDRETASTWDVLGRATGGPLEGSELEAVPHLDTFWFAWSAFQPDTEILLRDAAARDGG